MVWVWNISTYQTVLKLNRGANGGIPVQGNQFAWQPQSDNLVFSEGNISHLRYSLQAPMMVFWDVAHNRLLKQYSIVNTGSFAWSPDGKYLATGSYANHPAGDQVAVIDIQSGHQIYYEKHKYQVLSIAWSPDGKYLASSDVATVNVWVAP
jgi:WD40 repeat protein